MSSNVMPNATSAKLSLGDLVKEFYKSGMFRNYAPSTKATTVYAVKKIWPLLKMDINQVGPADVDKILDGLKPGSATLVKSKVSSIYKFARRRGYTTRNPTSDLSTPKLGEFMPWPEDQFRAMYNGSSGSLKTAILLGYHTGQRASDVLNMKWSDIRDGVIRITQKKTGIKLELPLHPELADHLSSLQPHGEYLVPNVDATSLSYGVFGNMFRRAREELGMPSDLKFHGLRKTMACRLSENSATTREVMAVGGWKSLRTVEGYMKQADQKALAQSAIRKRT